MSETTEPAPKQILVDARQACTALAIGRTKLGALTASETIPSVLVGRLRRYRVADLEEWVERGCPTKRAE